MESLIKADIFFFVTTIAVVLVSIGVLVALYYIVRGVQRFEDFADMVESNFKDASAEVREMAEEMRDSFVYNFLFKKKTRKMRNKS